MTSEDFLKKKGFGDTVSEIKMDSSNQTSSKPALTNQLQYILKNVIKQTMSHKFAKPFLKPVNGKIYTDYYPMISKPVDLSLIKKRLNDRGYSFADQCISDFKQMFQNCRTYNLNKDDPVILQMNDSLEAFVMEKLSKMPATEEVVQMMSKNKSVKKSKVASKVLNGHESPSNHPANIPVSYSTSNPTSQPILPSHNYTPGNHPSTQSQQHSIPSANIGSANVMGVKEVMHEGRNNMKRKVDSPVLQQSAKRERNVKKVKYNEVDDEIFLPPPILPISQTPVLDPNSILSPLSYCHNILLDILKPATYARASYFNGPFDVTQPQYHSYHQIIKKPIDLSIIQSKLQANVYQSSKEFADDMRLMFSNCYRFFPPEAEIVYAARYLQDIFELNFARIPETVPNKAVKNIPNTHRGKMEEEEEDEEDEDEQYLCKLDKLRQTLEKLQGDLARMTEEGRLLKQKKEHNRRQQLNSQNQYNSQSQQEKQQYLQQHQHLYSTPHHNNQSTNKESKQTQQPSQQNNNNNQLKTYNESHSPIRDTKLPKNNKSSQEHTTSQSSFVNNNNPNNINKKNDNKINKNDTTTAPPATTKIANNHVKPMTFDEIKKLSDDIQTVPAKDLFSMWEKLRTMEDCLKDSDPDEIELDFSAFKPSTLRWLQDYARPFQTNSVDDRHATGGGEWDKAGRSTVGTWNKGGAGGGLKDGGSGNSDNGVVRNDDMAEGGGSGVALKDLNNNTKNKINPNSNENHFVNTNNTNANINMDKVPGKSNDINSNLKNGNDDGSVRCGGLNNGSGVNDGKNFDKSHKDVSPLGHGGDDDIRTHQTKKSSISADATKYQESPFLLNSQQNAHQKDYMSPHQQLPTSQQPLNQFQNSSSLNQPPVSNQLFSPNPFLTNDPKQQTSLQQQQLPQQHLSFFDNLPQLNAYDNDYNLAALKAENPNNKSATQQQQPCSSVQPTTVTDQPYNNNNNKSVNQQPSDNITQLLKDVSSANNSPSNEHSTSKLPSLPPIIPHSSAAVSSVITNLIGSISNKSSPFNQSEGSNTPGSTGNNRSNKDASRLKSLGSWSSLAQMSKTSEQVIITKKNSEKSFNLFKKQAEEKKERERQSREQEQQRRQRMEQFEQQRKKKELEKQKAREEEEALASAISPYKSPPAPAANTSPPPTDESQPKILSQQEKNRLREQERRKRAARAGMIDMNAQSVLMADFEKNLNGI